MKKFSIITVCLNAPNLERTCESIVNQTFQDFEWIVIDGGSNAETLSIFEKYKSRMDYFVSEPDGGIYFGMNKGIQQASGERLNFLNAGDCFADLGVLDAVYAFSQMYPYSDLLHGIARKHNGRLSFSKDDMIGKYECLAGNICHQSAIFYKRDLFKKFGMYRTDFKIVSDYAYHMSLYIRHHCDFKHIDCIIADTDVDGMSDSSNPLWVPEHEKLFNEFFTIEEIIKERPKAVEKREKERKKLLIPDLRNRAQKDLAINSCTEITDK